MYAVIQTGGKQYKVSKGQVLKIEKLAQEVGQEVEFDKVLMINQDGDSKIGTPFLAGSKVKAEVLAQGRHKKIKIVKFKRRKHHDKQMGHRQYFTEVKITEIS
jgi:large subunit ribosomal protein L21